MDKVKIPESVRPPNNDGVIEDPQTSPPKGNDANVPIEEELVEE